MVFADPIITNTNKRLNTSPHKEYKWYVLVTALTISKKI